MAIIDQLKGSFQGVNPVSKLKEKMQPKPTVMKVCMMGARGVGKTSVLTSMFYDLNSVNADYNLQLVAAKDPGSAGTSFTATAIGEKHKELTNMFIGAVPGNPIRDAGISASLDIREYYFKFGLKGKRADLELQLRDFPGEHLVSYSDDIKAYIRESTAVLVAIDTPHMMECDGQFCDEKNGVSTIVSLFREALIGTDEEKLVLLIPLKCEKYSRENRMNEVADAVQLHYGELIAFLSSQSHIACAITPILTVGNVEFKEFLQVDGKVKTINNGKLPAKAIYVFCGGTPHYSPKYCEQPLCYLLSFVARLYKRSQQKTDGKLFKKLAAIFKLFPDDPSLLLEINRFSNKKLTNREGYRILSGKEFL